MTQKSCKFEIIDGPGRDRLFDCAKYFGDEDVRLAVKFRAKLGLTGPKDKEGTAIVPMEFLTRIRSISHEDGSGYSFNIEGVVKSTFMPIGAEKRARLVTFDFSGYYNAQTREGVFYPVSPYDDGR